MNVSEKIIYYLLSTIIMQDEGTLVYADIGQRPAPEKSRINTHLLDDNRVDYALLDHSVHEHKVSASQESSTAKSSGTCKQCYRHT